MPEFTKYQHVERIGSDEVDDLLVGKCYVFPKIDGTNASVWWDCGMRTGSRNRIITLEDDNAGFSNWIWRDTGLKVRKLVEQNKHLIFFGEWLVPHTLKTYRPDAWHEFYVFDVYDPENDRYLAYEDYIPILEATGVSYIPLLEAVTNPTEEHLYSLVERNTYLIRDGSGCGEGIVIKRYDYRNQWGRTTWGKIVRNEFKEQNAKVFGASDIAMHPLEERIIAMFVTPGRVDKIKGKMRESEPLVSRRIPELLERTWHDLITEEMWDILKEFKNATIDFGKLRQFCVQQVKALTPELFGN